MNGASRIGAVSVPLKLMLFPERLTLVYELFRRHDLTAQPTLADVQPDDIPKDNNKPDQLLPCKYN